MEITIYWGFKGVLLIVSLSNRRLSFMADVSRDCDWYFGTLYNNPDLIEAVHLLTRWGFRRSRTLNPGSA